MCIFKINFRLPFLSPKKIIECFTGDLMALRPTGDIRITQFMNNIYDSYILSKASFSLSIWTQYSSTINRTTNSCNNYYSTLNPYFYKGHQNIY